MNKTLTPEQFRAAVRLGLDVRFCVTDDYYYGPYGKTFITGYRLANPADYVLL